jgi:hypothetical protein
VRAVRTLTLALAVLAALLWTGAASATIIPQRSIADIALKMTGDQVKAVAGEPDRIHHGMNDFGNFTVYKYRRLKVTFLGSPGSQQVTAVSTTRRRQETPLGIHVGSTETALHAAYPGAHCRTESSDFRHCWTGHFQAGRRVTDYRIGILSGRVKLITVGFVID